MVSEILTPASHCFPKLWASTEGKEVISIVFIVHPTKDCCRPQPDSEATTMEARKEPEWILCAAKDMGPIALEKERLKDNSSPHITLRIALTNIFLIATKEKEALLSFLLRVYSQYIDCNPIIFFCFVLACLFLACLFLCRVWCIPG